MTRRGARPSARSSLRSGLSQDILLNFHPLGRTVDKKIRIPFHQPLNFSDSILQIVNGYVKLVSHSVTGVVGMNLVYFNSVADSDDPAKAPEAVGRRKKKIIPLEEAPPSPQTPRPPSPTPGPSGTQRRSRRATQKPAKGTEGVLRAGTSLTDRLRAVNTVLNVDYVRKAGAGRSKISNWPVAICLTPDGRVR